MDLPLDRPQPHPRLPSRGTSLPTDDRALASLLLGEAEATELPSAADVAAAATQLAAGVKRRVVLPLAGSPGELALERRGAEVIASLYSTTAQPEVHVWNRKVALGSLLAASARAVRSELDETPNASRSIALAVADRAASVELHTLEADEIVQIRGGAAEAPRPETPLAFGFEATLRGAMRGSARAARADVHALLFEGSLWAFLNGRRVMLARGPIVLPILRMLAAARSVGEARHARHAPNVRMRIGSFAIALRADAEGKITITLQGERGTSVTAAGLEASAALGPIAKLATDLVREVVAFDRTQARNLRIRAIREEVRGLRRCLKNHEDRSGFVNEQADLLRALAVPEPTDRPSVPTRHAAPSLRYGERWRVALDGLDAQATFLCGDRIVVASSKHTVALSRDDGTVLWARDADDCVCSMAGLVLVRSFADGVVELCSVEDGEPYAHGRLAPRTARPPQAMLVGNASTPPIAVFTEANDRLAAIDLRTGELVWRFAARASRPLELVRVGRMLVVGADDTVHGLDAITGEELFRHVEEGSLVAELVASRDRVFFRTERPRRNVVALDAYRGALLFRHEVDARFVGSMVGHDGGVLFAVETEGRSELLRLDAHGSVVFRSEDPGLGRGATPLVVDDRLVLNAAGGRVSAIDLGTGALSWSDRLARPSDDLPRLLEPTLRAGALFVPSSEVSILRPSDGSAATQGFPCDLIPDRLLVDERSWVYVAEESGHLAAYAPVAHLVLIRGGR